MTWMPASTWTPPAATNSSPSSSSAGGHWPLGTAHRPVGGQRQTGRPIGDARPQAPVQPEIPGPPAVPEAPAPWLFPSTDGPYPPGGARGGELPRLRDPVRRLDPAPGRSSICPGSPRKSPSTSSSPGFVPLPAHCLPQAELDGAALGSSAWGSTQPDRHPAGGGEAAHPQHPMVSAHRPPVAPQRGRHRRSHPCQARPAVSGSGAHPRQPRGSRR